MAGFFVNCDWGTSKFRLRAMTADGSGVLAEVESGDGVATIAADCAAAARPERFRQVLGQHLAQLAGDLSQLDGAPIVVSGMASASIGWHELPYAQVPWRLDGSDVVAHELEPIASAGGTHRVLLLSGLRTATDVMRGEEIQTLGLFQLDLAQRYAQRAIVVLPGTHSKHVQVEQGVITGFQTFMTGELFDAIGRHSILRHSIAAATTAHGLETAALGAAFTAGAIEARDLPLSAALFRVRTRQVLDGCDAAENRAFLSGVFIGGELAHLANRLAADVPIVLCATGELGEAYAVAGGALGLTDRLHRVIDEQVERLSALGQACVARRLGLL